MYKATIHHYNGKPLDERVSARGRTEHAALANAASRMVGRRVHVHIEQPVAGASTRYVYIAKAMRTGGVSLGPRMIAHVSAI